MKTRITLLSLLLITAFTSVKANCDTCRVEAKLHYKSNWDCSVTLTDSSFVPYYDSCTTYLYSTLDLDNGSSPFTFYSGLDTTYAYNQGNYTACLIAYARTITSDTTGTDTTYCSDTTCVSFYVDICHSPWRLKHTEEDLGEFSVFPNPSTANFTIITSEQANHLRITDINGKVVYDNSILQRTHQFNVDQFGTGVYIVQEISPFEKRTKKLILH
ncbi:MAG: T9SS type A sorting domain-containing protein [Vicingaceae bacterium]